MYGKLHVVYVNNKNIYYQLYVHKIIAYKKFVKNVK